MSKRSHDDLPLTLGLLVDTSMSQQRLIGQERSASFRFLEQVLREDNDQGFVIHFDREIELRNAAGVVPAQRSTMRCCWRPKFGKAIETAQRADTLAYSILFADDEAYANNWGRMPEDPGTRGKLVLQRLSRETGGGFFEVSRKQPLETVFSKIEDELRNQYSVGYTPDRTDAGPGFRAIHVVTKDQSLLVQSRDGYYSDR